MGSSVSSQRARRTSRERGDAEEHACLVEVMDGGDAQDKRMHITAGSNVQGRKYATHEVLPFVVAQNAAPKRPERLAGHSRASRNPMRAALRPTTIDLRLEPGPAGGGSPTRSPLQSVPAHFALGSPNRTRRGRCGLASAHCSLAQEIAARSPLNTSSPTGHEHKAQGHCTDWNLENVSPQCSPESSPDRDKDSFKRQIAFEGRQSPLRVPVHSTWTTTKSPGGGVEWKDPWSAQNNELDVDELFAMAGIESDVPPIVPFPDRFRVA